MGLSLKGLGRGIKKVGKAIGKGWEKIDDIALPAVGFALGGPAGAALGSAAARGIGDGKFNAGATLGAGVKGYAMGQLGSMAGLNGGSGIKALGGSAKNALMSPGGTAGNVLRSQVPGAAGADAGVGGGFGGMLKGLGGKLLGNSDLLLGGLSMYQGQKAQNQANDLQKRAMALAEQRYAETAPLREMGLKGLQNTQRRDLSATFRNAQNPFA